MRPHHDSLHRGRTALEFCENVQRQSSAATKPTLDLHDEQDGINAYGTFRKDARYFHVAVSSTCTAPVRRDTRGSRPREGQFHISASAQPSRKYSLWRNAATTFAGWMSAQSRQFFVPRFLKWNALAQRTVRLTVPLVTKRTDSVRKSRLKG